MLKWIRARILAAGHVELREWINLGVGVSTLILAIVSFWTTTRVSGIEGYLRSEIAHRNREFSTLADRSALAERAAALRREQNEKLNLQSNSLLAQAIVNERRLSEASDALEQLEARITEQTDELKKIKTEADGERKIAKDRQRTLEAIFRRQAYFGIVQAAGVFLIESTYRHDDGGVVAVGVEIVNIIKSAEPIRGAEAQYALAARNINAVCPTLGDRTIEVPVAPVLSQAPLEDVEKYKTQSGLAKYLLSMYQENNKRTAEWVDRRKDYYGIVDAKRKAIENEVNRCICLALGDEYVSSRDVCDVPMLSAPTLDPYRRD